MSSSGTTPAVGAGLIWGLAFVIPEVLDDVSAVALTAGRYVVYGLLSAALLLRVRRGLPSLRGADRRAALALAFAGNVGYYALLVIAIQRAGAPLAAAVIGTVPVSLAIAGGVADGTLDLRRLAPSLALILAGLLTVNAAVLGDPASGEDAGRVATGLLAAAGAVALWTWYGIANARFLAARPDIGAGTWSSVVGVATLLLAIPTLPAALLLGGGGSGAIGDPVSFVAAVVVLGVLVSWLATLLWNRAATRLPVGLAGQLIVVETLAGTAYSYIARGALPAAVTVAGFALLFAGVLTAIRRGARRPARVPA